ncbi:MAG: tetratricopeptide repeat protein [Candidatus Gastranaerophilales bacterium]|nr:tetratricopeptide repeat protein [Candidatus Gastranaerophilales bacterium]
MKNEMTQNVKNALDNFKKQDFKAAIVDFEAALAEDENNPYILNNIGLCYAKLAEDEKAIEYYEKALQLDNSMVQTYINLADIFYKQKRLVDIMNMLENAVTLMPENIVLKHYLARIYQEDSRYDLAIDQLNEILDLSPENTDAFWDLGYIEFTLGNYDSAISHYEQILDKIDNNELIYYQAALAYEANDNIDKAISNHLKAISVNSDFHPSYKKLGILFLARGEKEDAKEYLNDYVNFDLPDEEKNEITSLLSRIK